MLTSYRHDIADELLVKQQLLPHYDPIGNKGDSDTDMPQRGI
jgi:hypothetical protein